MKLQGKLGLPLILGLFVVATIVMGWLYYNVSGQFLRFARTNNSQLKDFQIQAAEKLFGATNAVLQKKIKMGNKRGLKTILRKQHVEGVEEVSVFNQVGKVVYSSKESFLGHEMDQEILDRLLAKREKVSLWTPRGFEIFDPQIITRKCTMCHVHDAWRGKEGGIGGVTYFRASTEAFRQIKGHNQADISNMKRSVSVIIAISLAVILLVGALLIVVLVGKLVRKPLNDTVVMLKNIAEGEGDLTSRLEVKRADEIGLLSKWFNTFVSKMQTMIIDIADNAATLSETSSSLSNFSSHMKSGTDMMTGKSNQVAAAAEKMNSQMDSMALSMDEAAKKVGKIAAAIEQITTTIHGISQNTDKAKSIAGEAVSRNKSAAGQINELGQAASEIGHITETITDISEQTNLLALNATIEAARAGDAGKGFAVVASEIKELARQTSEATESISQMIEGVQGTTTHTVDEIAEVSQIIASVDEIVGSIASSVKEQSLGMTEITNNLSQTTQVIQDLNKNARTSATFSGEIAEDMSGVHKAAGEILTSSAHMNTSAANMSKLAERLNEMVDNFKV